MWLSDPAKWPLLADKLLAAGEAGIDSETYAQPDKTSPAHRARVHCWSLGLLTARRNPRGYRHAVGVSLPWEAINSPKLREALLTIKLWAHNAPHDYHSFANMGLTLSIEDTLQWLRVTCPGRKDYGLKDAEGWALGLPSRPSFLDLVKHDVDHVRARSKKHRGCICGKTPCRAKEVSDWWDAERGWWRPHTRVEWRVFTPVHSMVEERWDVTEFNPAHERWLKWVDYMEADAVHGIELVDWLRNRRQQKVVYPWK